MPTRFCPDTSPYPRALSCQLRQRSACRPRQPGSGLARCCRLSSRRRYSLDLSSFQSALRWRGSEDKRLLIRGQIEASAAGPRPLTWVVGRPLRETVCELDGIDVCALPPQQRPTDQREARQDLLHQLADELGRPDVVEEHSSSPDVHFRLHCFLLWEAAFVEFVDMGFRDCWFSAVASYASSNIALRNSVIHGSTWAFLAVGKKAAPETAHSFVQGQPDEPFVSSLMARSGKHLEGELGDCE